MVAKDTNTKKQTTHPTYKSMVKTVIAEAKERKGCSGGKILKDIKSNFDVHSNEKFNTKAAINALVSAGEITNVSQSNGLNGRYKLAAAVKKAAPAKKTVAKKTATKKPVKTKTATPKKKDSPKKKTIEKKAAAKKASPKKKTVKKVTKSPVKKTVAKTKQAKKAPARKAAAKKKTAK